MLKWIRRRSGEEAADGEPEVLDYAGTAAALRGLVGRRVMAAVHEEISGAGVASASGYLYEPPVLEGSRSIPGETAFLLYDEPDPDPARFELGEWHSFKILDVRGFKGWDTRFAVICTFNGIRLVVMVIPPVDSSPSSSP